jgi:hypothetical protein
MDAATESQIVPTTTFSLAKSVEYSTSSPRGVVLADLNHDGKLDAATVSFAGGTNVLLGNGNGTFQQQHPFGGESNGSGIATADFNNDTYPDLAISVSRTGFDTLLGKGDGTFGMYMRVSGGAEGVAAGDFDKDGKMDLVTTVNESGGVRVALGKGDGTFAPPAPIYLTTPNPYGVIVADFNRDGKLDIGSSGGGFVDVLLGNGDGTFPLSGMNFAAEPGATTYALAAGDFNGDGKLDVVATNGFGGVTLSIFLGNGDGTLQTSNQVPCGEDPAALAVADLNLDGKLDIVEANDTGHADTIGVLLGKGDGTFEPFVSFSTGMGAHSVALGDLNGDGLLDVVVANKDEASISVLLNTSK